MSVGFIRLRRSAILKQLVLDRKAWSLLGIIAVRARFHDGANLHNLEIGEALVGDFEAAGLTRQEYREALKRLERKWFQITTRPTNHGTIAKLTESAVFDFSQPNRNQNTTNKQPPDFIGETQKNNHQNNHPTTIQQPLTNKEIRKEGVVVGALGNSVITAPTTKTTTTNLEELIEELKKAYPRHNIQQELRLCAQHYEKKHRPVTPTIFRAWMKRAELPMKAEPRRAAPRYVDHPPPAITPEMEQQYQALARRLREWRKNYQTGKS